MEKKDTHNLCPNTPKKEHTKKTTKKKKKKKQGVLESATDESKSQDDDLAKQTSVRDSSLCSVLRLGFSPSHSPLTRPSQPENLCSTDMVPLH